MGVTGLLLTRDFEAIIHAIGLILVIGYPVTYYFHLRELTLPRQEA